MDHNTTQNQMGDPIMQFMEESNPMAFHQMHQNGGEGQITSSPRERFNRLFSTPSPPRQENPFWQHPSGVLRYDTGRPPQTTPSRSARSQLEAGLPTTPSPPGGVFPEWLGLPQTTPSPPKRPRAQLPGALNITPSPPAPGRAQLPGGPQITSSPPGQMGISQDVKLSPGEERLLGQLGQQNAQNTTPSPPSDGPLLTPSPPADIGIYAQNQTGAIETAAPYSLGTEPSAQMPHHTMGLPPGAIIQGQGQQNQNVQANMAPQGHQYIPTASFAAPVGYRPAPNGGPAGYPPNGSVAPSGYAPPMGYMGGNVPAMGTAGAMGNGPPLGFMPPVSNVAPGGTMTPMGIPGPSQTGSGGSAGRSSSEETNRSSAPKRKRALSPGRDALVLIPEVALTGKAAGNRRPFQRRRRTRACDACRARKTKCDTPDEGPCAACHSASLQCRFSEGGEDKRKIGPQKRILDLETENKKLQREMNSLREGGQFGTQFSNMQQAGQFLLNQYGLGEVFGIGPDGVTMYRLNVLQLQELAPAPNAERSGTPEPIPSQLTQNMIDQFDAWMQQRGISTHDSKQRSSMRFSTPVGIASPIDGDEPLDLRLLMPPKEVGKLLCQIFREKVQSVRAIFHWKVLLAKFERAYANPIYDHEPEVVRQLFCPLMLLFAIAAQKTAVLADLWKGLDEDALRVGMLPQAGECAGWNGNNYVEFVTRRTVWNSPNYSQDDVLARFLRTLYLSHAGLPAKSSASCREMASFACANKLDRMPPPHVQMSDDHLENRRRLYWAVYIQDAKDALLTNRPMIVDSHDFVVGHIGFPRFVTSEMINDQDQDEAMVLELSLRMTLCQIQAATVLSSLISSPGGMMNPERLNNSIRAIQTSINTLPVTVNNPYAGDVLSMEFMGPLFFVQYVRLLLGRYYSNNLGNDMNSISIAGETAGFLRRVGMDLQWQSQIGLMIDDLTESFIFRAASVLVISDQEPKDPVNPMVYDSDITTILSALACLASTRETAMNRMTHLAQYTNGIGLQSPYAVFINNCVRGSPFSNSSQSIKSETSSRSGSRQRTVSAPPEVTNTNTVVENWANEFSGEHYSHTNMSQNSNTQGSDQQLFTDGTSFPIPIPRQWANDFQQAPANDLNQQQINPQQLNNRATYNLNGADMRLVNDPNRQISPFTAFDVGAQSSAPVMPDGNQMQTGAMPGNMPGMQQFQQQFGNGNGQNGNGNANGQNGGSGQQYWGYQ